MNLRPTRAAKLGFAIYVIFLAGYLGASGSRLLHPSTDIHFSYQADMWLHRRLDLGRPPPPSNDWAEVEYLHLKDGRTVAGTFLRSNPFHFRELGGKVERINPDDIANRWKKFYVSFPPFPSVIFLPFVAALGLGVNDVIITIFLAALAPVLLFFALRHLAARGDSTRSESDDLWLTAMFGFGTVFFYSSVIGQVWYTAHVVATVLTGLFVLASFEGRRPILAGLCLGAILLTRPHIAAWGTFFLYEAWRANNRQLPWKKLVAVAIPIAVVGGIGFAFNWARFRSIGEFGHFYLNVRWTDRIQRYGLTNFAFLSRNLSCALTLTPKFLAKAPFVQLSNHGMSLLLTTPAYLYLLWPRVRSELHNVLWVVVAPIAIAGLLYQNDGWVQFGYRFSNDFSFALIMLLAIGGRPLTRTWKALILVGGAVNLFGAITFGRLMQFYFDGFFPISPNEL
ncbi:MAG: hypothetical protein JWN44_3230 [Myxococcales bacterium]|nr:hypothetical protein [Myxococcales bacterium]